MAAAKAAADESEADAEKQRQRAEGCEEKISEIRRESDAKLEKAYREQGEIRHGLRTELRAANLKILDLSDENERLKKGKG